MGLGGAGENNPLSPAPAPIERGGHTCSVPFSPHGGGRARDGGHPLLPTVGEGLGMGGCPLWERGQGERGIMG